MKRVLKKKHPIMKRNEDAEYINIIHKSFRAAYLFSKAMGVMPLSYTRKKSVKITVANNRNINSMELKWCWKSAMYSGLWIALLITIRYFIMERPRPPRSEAFNERSNLTSENFSHRNSSIPPHFPNGTDHLIVSMNDLLEFTCILLSLITGVVGARKIPEIFRRLQDMDEKADQDGYLLLGES
jgi:hypothetical protein